jgi:hypothetical protein
MGEKIKIFICASQNDLSTEKNEKCFKEFMKLLEIFFGRFYNQKIEYSMSYEDKKNVTIKNANIFFVLLSKNLSSDDSYAKQFDELKNAQKNNLYKLLFDDIPKSSQPIALQSFTNYYFYYFNNNEDKQLDFFELSEKNNTLFNNKTINLGYDIINFLKNNSPEKQPDSDPDKNIYLAYCGTDQANNREIIKRELINKGFNIFPKNIPVDSKEKLSDLIHSQISKTHFAIHILGEDNLDIENSEENLVEVQNNIAIEHFNKLKELNIDKKELSFSRLIWLPNNLQVSDESQQIWLENFIQSAETQIGAELVETPIETFKTIIDEKLKIKANIASRNVENGDSLNKVYILYEFKNKEKAESIGDLLKTNNQKPVYTLYDKNYLSVIENHRQNLVEADSIIILYMNNNPDWLFSKIMDIKKSPGFGRRKSFENIILIHSDGIDSIKFDMSEYTKLKADQNLEKALTKLFAKTDSKK